MRKLLLLSVLALGLFAATAAQAVPILQIYIEGASYDAGSETWVLESSGTFTIWVIGNISGPGGAGTIEDVQLVAAYLTSEAGGTVTLTPTTTGDGTYTDPSVPGAPVAAAGGGDGAIPVMNDGSDLPTHGIYGPGSGHSFLQWELGDFDTADSPTGDFITAFPAVPDAPGGSQINAYDVTVTGFTWLHFDAFNHVEAGQHAKYVFAPFSHDGETGGAPEPPMALLFGSGLVGLVGMRLRRK
jgi:hypothetical protein